MTDLPSTTTTIIDDLLSNARQQERCEAAFAAVLLRLAPSDRSALVALLRARWAVVLPDLPLPDLPQVSGFLARRLADLGLTPGAEFYEGGA